jgi:hypothetical protein
MSDDDFNTGYGSLAGDGIDVHNSVKTSVKREGTEFKLRCDKCNKMLVVTVPWDELTILGMGLLPPNRGQGAPWRYEPHNGMFMPNVACSCHEDVRLGITPDECNRHLKSMIAAGHVSEVQIGGLIAQIKGARR